MLLVFCFPLSRADIYKKYYTLKGEKMEEVTRRINEMHQAQTSIGMKPQL